MNKKNLANIFLVVIIFILVGAVGYFLFVKTSGQVAEQSILKDEVVNWKTYRNEKYGVEIKYPQSWYAYGDKNEFANVDLLSWRGFVPNYDVNKSMEEQELFSVTVFNKNPSSTFDSPKRFITKTRTDEKWEQIIMNGYTGTKITNTTINTVTDYVFEHNGKLYIFSTTQTNLFDKILPTLKFF